MSEKEPSMSLFYSEEVQRQNKCGTPFERLLLERLIDLMKQTGTQTV